MSCEKILVTIILIFWAISSYGNITMLKDQKKEIEIIKKEMNLMEDEKDTLIASLHGSLHGNQIIVENLKKEIKILKKKINSIQKEKEKDLLEDLLTQNNAIIIKLSEISKKLNKREEETK